MYGPAEYAFEQARIPPFRIFYHTLNFNATIQAIFTKSACFFTCYYVTMDYEQTKLNM
jgi:hypothetical protein